ncbi:hypothetical protein HYU16_02175 [Candidatus Woesearchaeota archaeon]|nr:hypothetical protein [Candidatus Woesearchaeota archaeon]
MNSHSPDPLETIIVSDADFMQSYAPASHPEAVEGLDALADAGFRLPLTYLSEGFRQLSTLAWVVQFSGNMQTNYGVSYHFRECAFAGRSRVTGNLKKFASRRESKGPNHPRNSHYHYNRLSHNGTLVGRMLSQLGVRREQSQNLGLAVPPHFLNLATAYAYGQTSFDGTAKLLLEDAVSAMFYTSMAQSTGQGFKILRLPAQTTRAAALNLATQISHVIQSVFPDEEIDSSIRQIKSKSKKLPDKTPIYNPFVRFSPQAYERIASVLGP